MKTSDIQFHCSSCGTPILADEPCYATLEGEWLCESCYVEDKTRDPLATILDYQDRIYNIKSRFHNLDDARDE